MKALSHIYVMKVVLDDAKDGKVTIPGFGDYAVDTKYRAENSRYSPYFYAGAIGPDGFPDMITGQMEIHATTDIWLHYMRSIARKHNSPSVWAFYAGYMSHCLADMWTHDWVNHYAGSPWPATEDLKSLDYEISSRAWNIVARHIAIERTLDIEIKEKCPALEDTKLKVPVDYLVDCILNTKKSKYHRAFAADDDTDNKPPLRMPELPIDIFGGYVDRYWTVEEYDRPVGAKTAQDWADVIKDGLADWIKHNRDAWQEIISGRMDTVDALTHHWQLWFIANALPMATGSTVLGKLSKFIELLIENNPIEALNRLLDTTVEEFIDMALKAVFQKDKEALKELLHQQLDPNLFVGSDQAAQEIYNKISAEIGTIPALAEWQNINRDRAQLNGPLYNAVVTTKIMMMKRSERQRFLEEICRRPICNLPINFPQGIVALDGSGQFAVGDFAPFWHDFIERVGKEYTSAYESGYLFDENSMDYKPSVRPLKSADYGRSSSPKGVVKVYRSKGQEHLNTHAKSEPERQGWQIIVPGNFRNGPRTDLLFYDPVRGVGKSARVCSGGLLSSLKERWGWRRTWKQIIPGNFSDNDKTDLLFYDPTQGHGEFYSVNNFDQLAFTRLDQRQHRNWSKTWRSIIPGNFSDNDTTDLFFYDPYRGEAKFYTTDGRGGIQLLGQKLTGLGNSWYIIVPGHFSNSPYTELLFYAPEIGDAQFYATDGQGGLTLSKGWRGWRKTWRAIVPGKFVDSQYTSLFFYDTFRRDAQLYRMGGNFTPSKVRDYDDWGKWRMLVPGNFGGGQQTDLLLYGVTE